MSTVTLLGNRFAITDYANKTLNDHTSDLVQFNGANMFDKELYVGYKSLNSSYLHLPIKKFEIWYGHTNGSSFRTELKAITGSWNQNDVTYNSKPSTDTLSNSSYFLPTSALVSAEKLYDILEGVTWGAILRTKMNEVLNYGTYLAPFSGSLCGVATPAYSNTSYRPRLVITFEDETVPTFPINPLPNGGYVNPYTSHNFIHTVYNQNPAVLEPFNITEDCGIEWKNGTNGTAHRIAASSSHRNKYSVEDWYYSSQSYTDVPANTFPVSSNMYWRGYWETDIGTTFYSDWIQFSTAEVTSTASINSPANTVVDGSAEIELSWNHIITTGTAPTGADLQKSNDGSSTWSSLASVTGSETSTTIPANTFSAGEWMWRVRTYNSDNVAGAWSSPASFISVAAPTVQGVAATFTPRPVISWQSDGQVGYQVKIGEYDLGQKFGTANSIKSPIYLDDGSYIVYVRVRNQYGLWSPWVDAPLNVSNVAGDAITLTAVDGSGFAALTWSTDGTYESFLVYRDGVAIARVYGNNYEDHLAIGSHSYSVKGIIEESDNYGVSNTVTIVQTAPCLMIADLKAKVWIPLPLSSNSLSENTMSLSSETSVYKNFATAYPVAETTKYKNKSITFRVAFLDPNEARGFEGLIGRMVIVKTARGDIITGALTSVSKTQNEFFDAYTGYVQHTYVAEEILL